MKTEPLKAKIRRRTKDHITNAYRNYLAQAPHAEDELLNAVRAFALPKAAARMADIRKMDVTAEDMTQDFLLLIWGKLSEFRSEPESFYDWLHTIAFRQFSRAAGRLAEELPLGHLCESDGVEFDPNAPVDNLNRYGKQCRLQQWWGTEFRRAECPTYWLDRVQEEIASSGAAIVLIDDMRFLNEADWVKSQKGTTVQVSRPGPTPLTGEAVRHIAEHALADYSFDFTIHNNGTLGQLHGMAEWVFVEVLRRP